MGGLIVAEISDLDVRLAHRTLLPPSTQRICHQWAEGHFLKRQTPDYCGNRTCTVLVLKMSGYPTNRQLARQWQGRLIVGGELSPAIRADVPGPRPLAGIDIPNEVPSVRRELRCFQRLSRLPRFCETRMSQQLAVVLGIANQLIAFSLACVAG
jgi:hypothetical protein